MGYGSGKMWLLHSCLDVYVRPWIRAYVPNPDEIRMANGVLDFKWRYKQSILNPLFQNARS